VDVRAALRRTRLPFVASLFLAALLGLPGTPAPAIDPLPVPVVAAVAAAPASATSVASPVEAPVAEPVAPSVAAVPAVVDPGVQTLADQVGTAASGPRAPPFSA
jgi:hypothetical protein